jgi:large subunit ribosomal protein L24
MKVKKNDTVVVITGKDLKKTGKVLVAMPKTNKIIVEGVNVQEKNRKARTAQETSQKIKKEGAIDASNVLVICPVCNKATRVGYAEIDGKKVRICKKCKASLDVKVEKKEVAKKAPSKAKKEVKKEVPAVENAVEAPAVETKEVKKTTAKKTTTKKATSESEAKTEVKKTSTRKKTASVEKAENADA